MHLNGNYLEDLIQYTVVQNKIVPLTAKMKVLLRKWKASELK